MELTRKCKICGKNIFIERDRSTFFYDKTGFYHKDCFVEKKKNQKRPWTDDLLRAFFDKVKDTTDKKVDDLLSKKREQDHNRELAHASIRNCSLMAMVYVLTTERVIFLESKQRPIQSTERIANSATLVPEWKQSCEFWIQLAKIATAI